MNVQCKSFTEDPVHSQHHHKSIGGGFNNYLFLSLCCDHMSSSRPSSYIPLHPELYHFDKDLFEPELIQALENGTREAILSIIDISVFGVFSFKCLRPEVCEKFVEELEHLERSGVSMQRPNSMNRYGAILDYCGFGDVMANFVHQIVQPLALTLFNEQVNIHSAELTYHHAFTVRYSTPPLNQTLMLKIIMHYFGSCHQIW